MLKITNKKIAIIIIILIAIVAYFVIRGCNKEFSPVYRYERADIGEVKKTISVTGTLEILNSHLVLSKISGLVTDVHVDFNSNVKKNQLLATLDPTSIDQELSRIDAKREGLANEILIAKKDLNAKRDLFKEDLISQRALDEAELQYNRIEVEWKQAQNEYEIIRKKKSYTKILSPTDGIIISKDIEPNIPITENKVLFEIAEDLKEMQLIILVDESDIGFIKIGQNVIFTVSAHPDKSFKGKITQVRINPIKKDQLVLYQALVTCDNSELLLKPGMTATATVEVDTIPNVLRVLSEAFIVSPFDNYEEDTGKKYIWKKRAIAIDSLPVEKVEVKIKLVGDYYTEIESDKIKPGDEILVGIDKNHKK